jgi:light-regulated signal transduction histidine kinase (bacteriophytochrome)
LESFAYVSSHDLQEPLRKIQTFSSQIMEKEVNNLSANGKYKFERMQRAAARMQRLIEDLLAYSRTSSVERKFEKINLGEIIAEVKEDLKEELQRKQAIIQTSNLCNVNVIPFQFRQLMYNLISNSLKFSKKNETPLIKIQCIINAGAKLNNEKLSDNLQYVHISISDNGIGFEPQYKEKIFEVFQRLHLHEEYSGTGIGLAIVKKIIENHHGFIAAESELNKGATFHIFLPASV